MIPSWSVFESTQHRAHGTSLAAMVFIGLVGAATYALQGRWTSGLCTAGETTANLTAHRGARHASSLPEWKLKRHSGPLLFSVSILLFLKPFIPHFVYFSEGWKKVFMLLACQGSFNRFLSGMLEWEADVIMIP